MFIQPITFLQTQNTHRTSFKTNLRVVNNSTGKLQYRATTSFFRGDLQWESTAKYFRKLLNEIYNDTPKINLYDFACSSGEETISIILSFMKYMKPEEYKRFFPIIAIDLDKENIKDAKSGYLFVNNIEKSCLEGMRTSDSQFKFYNITQSNYNYINKTQGLSKFMVKFSKDVLKNAKFSVGDILTKIDSLPKTSSIIYCRNMWPYLPRVDQIMLLKKISDKFKNTNSYIVFGDYDNAYGSIQKFKLYRSPTSVFNDNDTVVHHGLNKFGYEPTEIHNVFKI